MERRGKAVMSKNDRPGGGGGGGGKLTLVGNHQVLLGKVWMLRILLCSLCATLKRTRLEGFFVG